MLKNVIRNRTTEKDVRIWLDQNGFYGNSADIGELELYAIERPGWLQIFSFQVRVKSRDDSPDPWSEQYGVVKDDERRQGPHKTQVELFVNHEQQQEKLTAWSAGLICRGEQTPANLLGLTIAMIVFAIVALSVINFLT